MVTKGAIGLDRERQQPNEANNIEVYMSNTWLFLAGATAASNPTYVRTKVVG